MANRNFAPGYRQCHGMLGGETNVETFGSRVPAFPQVGDTWPRVVSVRVTISGSPPAAGTRMMP